MTGPGTARSATIAATERHQKRGRYRREQAEERSNQVRTRAEHLTVTGTATCEPTRAINAHAHGGAEAMLRARRLRPVVTCGRMSRAFSGDARSGSAPGAEQGEPSDPSGETADPQAKAAIKREQRAGASYAAA